MKTVSAVVYWSLAGAISLVWMGTLHICELRDRNSCDTGQKIADIQRLPVLLLSLVWGVGLTILYKWLIHGVYEKSYKLFRWGRDVSIMVNDLCGKKRIRKIRSKHPALSRKQRLYYNINIVLVSTSITAVTNGTFHLISTYYLLGELKKSIRNQDHALTERLTQRILDHTFSTVPMVGILGIVFYVWLRLGALIQWKSKNIVLTLPPKYLKWPESS